MIGSWKWNFFAAALAMALTFMSSVSQNGVSTTFTRSMYTFVIVFGCMFIIRWIFGTVAGLNNLDSDSTRTMYSQLEEPNSVGQHIDLASDTDSEELHELLVTQLKSSDQQEPFTSLEPTKLMSLSQFDPEKMAESVRKLTEE